MKCPYCAGLDTKVLETRGADDGRAIKRRRECHECGRRFTTYEKMEEAPLVVVKKGGQWQSFERGKLMSGLLRACEKRPVPLEKLEKLVDDVERELRSRYEREVPSQIIGELVMEKLRSIDEVAYVRFASVYRQFKDLNMFLQELEQLIKAQREIKAD